MDNGYKQFFKKARENAKGAPDQGDDRMILKKNNRPSREKQKNLQRKTNPYVTFLCLCGFVAALLGFYYLDGSEKFFSKIEISLFGRAHAETAKEAPKDESKAKDSAKKAVASQTEAAKEPVEKDKVNAKTREDGGKIEDAAEAGVGGSAVFKKEFTEEELNHFARLSERKSELDKREKEIQKMETDLAMQKDELEKRMKELEEMRKKISSVLEDKVQLDEKRIENLVQFYSNMKPQQAARIMETIDESLAVEVLARMKKKNAAEIMNLLKAEKAQVISEKYAGYRK